MRRAIAILLLAAVMLSSLSGCKQKEDPYFGYSLEGALTGGVTLGDANARTVEVSENGGNTSINITFHIGSRMSGGGEETTADSVPQYKVYTLGYPSRLVVEFTSLAYSDYERDGIAAVGCVMGGFMHRKENSQSASVYFQLSSDVAYKASNSGGTLSLELKPRPAPEQKGKPKEAYQVTANAYKDFCSGKLAGAEMTPTLDAGLKNVLLISGVFDSDISAELFINNIVEANISAVREEWTIIPSEYGKLPEYDETLTYKAAYSEAVIRVNGSETAAEVLLPDGWFLTDIPRRAGGGSLYTKRVSEKSASDEYECEKLYVRTGDGTSSEYIAQEFDTIESAAFSPDGRKLAVLERAAETANLYIFDVQTEELLTNLADMGFGNTISAYTWDDLGTTLYAVSGSDGMQLHQYDFNVPSENKRHSLVEKNGADEGCIAYCDGEVYFLESDMELGDLIYRVKSDGGVRKQFTYGSVFELSGNNAYMAINASSGVTVTSTQNVKFRLYDMHTGETTTVTNAFGVQDFIWSKDCSRVYYFENRLSGSAGEGGEGEAETAAPAPQDDYPYTLWMYDVTTGENTAVADLPSTAIFPSEYAGCIYFNYNDTDTMGEKVRAAYIIDVDALLEMSAAQ